MCDDGSRPEILSSPAPLMRYLVTSFFLYASETKESFKGTRKKISGPEVMYCLSCSTQLSMKFSILINMKMPTMAFSYF